MIRLKEMVRRLYRKSRYILLIFIVFFCVNFYLNYSEYKQSEIFREKFLKYLANASSRSHCDLPLNLSPRDESILQYIKELPKHIECSEQNPVNAIDITIIDEESNFLRQTDQTASCFYRIIERKFGNDDEYLLSEEYPLDKQNGLELDKLENYIAIKCKQTNGRIYRNIHSWFNPPTLEAKTNTSTSTKPSVLIMVVESLSRLNYLRWMPLTKKFVESKLPNVHYLEGLNKMADNSYPNMVPFLSGKRAYTGEIKNDEAGPYDDIPLIWKEFSKASYWTALIEDEAEFTLFNYIAKGFVNQPTTFYPRPAWIYAQKERVSIVDKIFAFSRDLCMDGRYPMIDVLFNQTYSFIKQSSRSGRPFFAFSFAIQVTHNDFNRAQKLDVHLRDFFSRILPYLDNTVVIFMGDHGNRYGDVLDTNIGRIESRMPLFAISVPEKLKNRAPHLDVYLEKNRQRLVTWKDLHLVLMDIAKDDYREKKVIQNPEKTTEYSVWREEVPINRTCENAQIPDFFCVCDTRKSVATNSDFVKEAAKALINLINSSLSLFSECIPLTLSNITRAELIFMPSEIESSKRRRSKYEQRIELTIVAEPSIGLFRGRLKRTASDSKWQTKIEDIARLNAYGSQSACINDRRARVFCYCRDYSPTTNSS